MAKKYLIEEARGEEIDDQGYAKIIDGYRVTDGNWISKVYTTKDEAQKALDRALWGEGTNTI